jgi:hypothetical protein
MLVVDPAHRNTLKNVMEHPWFLSKQIHPSCVVAPPMEKEKLLQPIEADLLESDILDSLNLLGWTNKPELTKNLTSMSPNHEKLFYNLLHKRKIEMLEQRDAEKDMLYEQEGGPKRRTDSPGSKSPEPRMIKNLSAGSNISIPTSPTRMDAAISSQNDLEYLNFNIVYPMVPGTQAPFLISLAPLKVPKVHVLQVANPAEDQAHSKSTFLQRQSQSLPCARLLLRGPTM